MLVKARAAGSKWSKCWFSSAIRCLEDEGDWSYSAEWWGTESGGHTVFRSNSEKGNGVVSVVAHPASTPATVHWPEMERWIRQRHEKIYPDHRCRNEEFKILGYQWRVLHFNDITRQSAAKIMAAYRKSDPDLVFFMQQPHCLAVPYVKSMISAGLAALASCHYDFTSAVSGKKIMNVLCIGQGGGSIPLFLASKIQGANINIVEIDPIVIAASIEKMGFPALSRKNAANDVSPNPHSIDQILWKGVHERLSLYESDAEDFIIKNANIYDLIFVDAYDGSDVFPHKLWDPNGPFLEALRERLHPEHGTVVVNLHADDIPSLDQTRGAVRVCNLFEPLNRMGKHVSKVCRAYTELLWRRNGCNRREKLGLAFTVAVPWVLNTTLVVCRGFEHGRMEHIVDGEHNYYGDLILNTLLSKSQLVEKVLNLPFPCSQYVKGGFELVFY